VLFETFDQSGAVTNWPDNCAQDEFEIRRDSRGLKGAQDEFAAEQ
jgi:hypothetical protein